MVKALRDAIEQAQKLPEPEQAALAAIIRAEIEDEAAWQKRFAETSPTLEELVKRAKSQYRKGHYGDFPAQ